MPRWSEVQRDFSGGEIGLETIMRDDTEKHAKAVLTMENFYPTLTGSAMRVPGTRYVDTIDSGYARIIPYKTPDNKEAIVELSSGAVTIRTGLGELFGSTTQFSGAGLLATVSVLALQNPESAYMKSGHAEWNAVPPESSSGDDRMGWLYNDAGAFVGWARDAGSNANDVKTCTISCTITVSEDAPFIKSVPSIEYVGNGENQDGGYTASVVIARELDLNDEVFRFDFDDTKHAPGYIYNIPSTIVDTFTAGEQLRLTFTFTAVKRGTITTYPSFAIYRWPVWSNVQRDVTPGDVNGTVPAYTREELDEIQFVQSPYPDSVSGNTFGKELVLVHPNYPPKRIYFDGANYLFADIDFNSTQPDDWNAGTYPCAVTSYLGRCVFAGSFEQPIEGFASSSPSETVWSTEVGNWDRFTLPADQANEITPDQSVEFTTTYRSPIQWVLGQKQLLVGAQEMEYVASADGIFQPGDLGVFMQSSHGSARVQPVAMGQYALFPAENGNRVREYRYMAEEEGWISRDMTLAHPKLFQSGIRRMVRMRTPHQMMVAVNGNGQLCILSLETHAGVFGWSRVSLDGNVKDACVVQDTDGHDILLLTVQRFIDGVKVMYLEAISNWRDIEHNTYMQCMGLVNYETPSNVLTGLDHLTDPDAKVQVIGDGVYLGQYTVVNGEVTLVTDYGSPIEVTTAIVGRAMPCRLVPMPLVTKEPDSKKKYTKVVVRTLNSTRPVINGERPADRDPDSLQDTTQRVDLIRDNQVAKLGSDSLQIITIEENVPLRCEVVGLFGTVEGHDVN